MGRIRPQDSPSERGRQGDRFIPGPWTLTALGSRSADSQGVASWGPRPGATNGFPGQLRAFQLLYRDPSGPCGNGFNLSNGVPVVLTP